MPANWMDHAIASVAPRMAARRVLARQAFETLTRGYDGASKGRRTDGWRAPGSSADTEIGVAGALLRDRMRDLVRNNPHAAKAVAVLVNNIVGSGIMPRAASGDDKLDRKVDALFERWTADCDADGQLDFYGLQTLICREMVEAGEVLAGLDPRVAAELGLSAGTPVLVGAGDYPMALLGSGVTRTGMGSDVTGTSTIITLLHDDALVDPSVSNVLTPNGIWGVMTLLEAGGDAVRWARRALHDNRRSYEEVADLAIKAAPGAGGLFFLPYLSGERVAEKHNSRAQFFGLKAETALPNLHRAVLEGVAFSVRRVLDRLPADKARPDRIVAASGGAKSALWLKIKASMYRVPYVVPEELECGVVGAAALMAASTGGASDLEAAVARMVRFNGEILPDPAWADLYDRMMPIYARLYESSKSYWDDLDAL